MTVREFIDRLNTFNQDAQVIVKVPQREGHWEWEPADEFDEAFRSLDILEDGNWKNKSVLTLAIFY